jgi:phosphopantothenoylcysteine decarboxylase/phosphopantothenate--cysteine ligase
VHVVLTRAATRFVGPDTFAALTDNPVHTSLWERPGEVLHVRLAREADVAVVAPATANVIAKIALGLADDLLSSTLLEFSGPLVIAPAMHAGMWTADATQHNVDALRARAVVFVGPVEGALAAGDSGPGRLAEPDDVLAGVARALRHPDLAGRRVLVTAGPTHEPIDPVRYVGNRSSGKMGVAIAAEAVARAAEVTLVLGPGTVAPPADVRVVRVQTAEQMRVATREHADAADVIVMAAAVADFRPKAPAEAKLKKDHGVPELALEPTPDILAELAERRRAGQVLVGFAAETDEVEGSGRDKLRRKRVDLLVANRVGREGTGFGSDTNEAAILAASGSERPLRRWSKRELAEAVLDAAVQRMGPIDSRPS